MSVQQYKNSDALFLGRADVTQSGQLIVGDKVRIVDLIAKAMYNGSGVKLYQWGKLMADSESKSHRLLRQFLFAV